MLALLFYPRRVSHPNLERGGGTTVLSWPGGYPILTWEGTPVLHWLGWGTRVLFWLGILHPGVPPGQDWGTPRKDLGLVIWQRTWDCATHPPRKDLGPVTWERTWDWVPHQQWTDWKHYLPHPSDVGGDKTVLLCDCKRCAMYQVASTHSPVWGKVYLSWPGEGNGIPISMLGGTPSLDRIWDQMLGYPFLPEIPGTRG